MMIMRLPPPPPMFFFTFLLLQLLLMSSLQHTTANGLKFGLINGDSDFFKPIATGFFQRCEELGIDTVNRTNMVIENDNGTSTVILRAKDNFRELLYGIGGIGKYVR
jgi:hypothetical protein